MSLTPAFLDELRARSPLSSLVGKSIKLTRAGNEWKGCCPFHNEKTPSFYVNDGKAFYHCFGCSAHGDAIRWLQEYHGLPFMEAVKELAAAAGMDVPAADPRAQERADRKEPLFKAMEASQSYFASQREVRAAADYLEKRGITPTLAATFGIGFAPDGNGIARGTGQPVPVLVEAGMMIAVDGRDPYDRFRNRLMFPIKDARSRVIAFGGRIIGDGEPKYLNSPETPLFDKGRTLYNIDRAAAAARRAGRLVVVEGYMDVIGLASVGLHEAVAPNGTAITETQLALMWRMVDVPILCMDGDKAGKRAMVRAAERALPMLEPGKSLAFAALPPGQDPDDVARKAGIEAMDAILARAKPLAELLWLSEVETLPTTPEARAALRQRLAGHANAIKDAGVRDEFLREFKARFERQFGERTRRQDAGRRQDRVSRPISTNLAVAKAVLAGLLRYPDVAVRMVEQLVNLPDDRRLADLQDAMVDHVLADKPPQAMREAMMQAGFADAIASLRTGARLPFSFTREDADPQEARRDLEDAIARQAVRR